MSQSRREFVKVSLATTGTLYLSANFPVGKVAQAADQGDGGVYGSLYLQVTPGNEFIFSFDKSEMGQGVITGQATMFGEEADIDPKNLIMKPAIADPAYGTNGGHMITGGSTSTVQRFDVLRRVGASYREHVLMAAAQDWKVPKAELATNNGEVYHKTSGKKSAYADFNKTLSSIESPDMDSVVLKERKDWKYIGKVNDSLDAYDKSTGAPEFGLDFELPGMKTAIVLRSPVFGGVLESYDDKAIKGISGVVDVKKVHSGVAVICDTYWACLKAKRQIKSSMMSWKIEESDKINSQDLIKNFHALLDKDKPSVEGEEKLISASYSLPYLSHSPMEPQNGLAWKQKDKFEFWVPTQMPTFIQNYAAMKSGVDREKVRVNNAKYLGGGFGRRGQLDYPMELVDIATQVDYPVKLMWSREDDVKCSPMRPMTAHRLDAVVGADVKSWRHQMAGQSILQGMMGGMMPLMLPEWLPESIGSGIGSAAEGVLDLFGMVPMMQEGSEQPYALPVDSETVEVENKVPVTFWRSVGHSHNGFVVESFLDEVLHAQGKEPLAGRLELLQNAPRAKKVVELVAEKSNYRNYQPPKGRGIGIAYHFSFKTHCAQVAEVEVKGSEIIVHKVVAAVDAGTVINPEIVRMQVQSGIIYGLSAALYGSIDFSNGKVRQSNFHDYPVVRMTQTPEIEVHIVDSTESPTGIGEPGLPPIAPAVANAVFNATGRRLRELPLKLG